MFRPRRNVAGSFTASQWRKHSAEARFDTALQFYRDVGWIEEGLIYDEEHSVRRFEDGTFAFSREYANWSELERRGFRD